MKDTETLVGVYTNNFDKIKNINKLVKIVLLNMI